MLKIAIQKTDFSSRESIAITDVCIRESIPFRPVEYGFNVRPEEIAVGSVEFVEAALGRIFKPDYHPIWLKEFVKRKTWILRNLPEIGDNIVFKPNDRYKLFNLTTIEFMTESLNGSREFFCQDWVDVGNEWRIYVSDGKFWNCSWYSGPDENKEIDLDVLEKIVDKIPKNWYGTIDIMETNHGIELCECHHPYSIGWYGDPSENQKYFDFIVGGYKYLKNENNKIRY